MDERALRQALDDVKKGALRRRDFIRMMAAMGLAAPIAAQMLASVGVVHAQPKPTFTPQKRGGGGVVKTLWWQSPTLLNPHFAVGTGDWDGCRVFYEPLASFDADGHLVPILAADIPSVESGGVAKDGRSVTWKLKRGVRWHDGEPFTADDCVFNYEYSTDPATGAVSSGAFRNVDAVEKVDTHTVRIRFKKPMPFWASAFCGVRSMIIPKHLFEPYKGAKSREAPNNAKPVGTGPFRHVDFKPGDLIRAELNPTYHVPNRPFFDTFEMKGGGDTTSAARAVLQTGEYDYAWNIQIEDDLLKRLEQQGGKGRAVTVFGGYVEHLQLNNADPWKEVDGERASPKSTHPFLTDPAVRQALGLLVDRENIQKHIYGRTGIATASILNAPPRYHSKSAKSEFNIERANQILDAGGWKRGPDGVRVKDGKKLSMVFHTTINAPRQKTQQIVKQAAAKAGIELQLKAVPASVFFSSDPGNPDTFLKFFADLQMYTAANTSPDPEFFMNQFTSWEASCRENKWQGRNKTRWRNEEYDKLFRAQETEIDPVKRAALFIKMNDLVIRNVVVIPIVWRSWVSAVGSRMRDVIASGWDSDLWALAYWSRT